MAGVRLPSRTPAIVSAHRSWGCQEHPMRNRNRRAGLAAAAAVMLLAGAAQAATTTFTDRTAFMAGLTSTIVDDYSDPGYHDHLTDAAMNAVVGEADYASPDN